MEQTLTFSITILAGVVYCIIGLLCAIVFFYIDSKRTKEVKYLDEDFVSFKETWIQHNHHFFSDRRNDLENKLYHGVDHDITKIEKKLGQYDQYVLNIEEICYKLNKLYE